MPTKKVTSIANSWRKTTPITRNEDNCPQIAWRQVFRHLLRSQSARRRDNEDNIRHNNQMGQSADGIRLQVKVCARRADSTCGAVSRTSFDYKTSEIDKICFFFQKEIFFSDTQTVKLNDIKNYLQSDQTFQYVFKWIQNDVRRQSSEAQPPAHFKKEAETLTIRGVIYRSNLLSIPPKFRRHVIYDTHKTHLGRQATETALRLVA